MSAPKTASALITVDRWLGGATSGCHGVETYRFDGGGSCFGAISLRTILKRPLNPGARVRITVEVLDEGRRLPSKCENPWPSHRCSP